MSKEAKARIKINKLLEESGWRFFDNAEGKANIVLENHIKIDRPSQDNLGDDFQNTKNGFIDYLLLDDIKEYGVEEEKVSMAAEE